VLPLGLFKLLKPYVDQIDNIHLLEAIMFSHKLTIAGQVDCVAEYNGKLSVIDFKTANKERQESWIDNYFMQCSAYAIMYEETFGTPIEQIVIMLASEDGTSQIFVKERKDYEQELIKAIDGFYKYYEKLNKDKVEVK
jgi:genome maintenance exonuclease 1